jgi:hypothetical protein
MIPLAIRPRAALAAGAVVLALLALAYVGHLRQRAERAEHEAEQVRAAAAVAGAQADVERGSAVIADRAQAKALSITVRAQEAEHEIRILPEADTPLPSALRDGVRAGVLGLRERGPAAGPADGSGGSEPAPALPEAPR